MKMILNIKIIIFFLFAMIIFALGLYAFKKSEVQTVQIIVNDNQIASTTESIKEEIAQNSIGAENTPADAAIEQNESSVVEKNAKPAEDAISTAQKENSPKAIIKLFTSGFQVAEGRKIDTIIIHSSYDALGDDPYSISGIIQEYKDYGVSAHYLIGRDGAVYQLVREKDIAYHAGVSSVPDGRTDVNAFSIGIELVNTKTGKFTASQYSALNNLISEIKSRYNIKYVLGHNQIAPERKDDPWNFEWDRVHK